MRALLSSGFILSAFLLAGCPGDKTDTAVPAVGAGVATGTGTGSTTDSTPVTGAGTGSGTGTGTGTGSGTGTGTGSATGSSSCASPLGLQDPDMVSGDTTTAVDIEPSSCQMYGGGSDDVYEFTPAQDGFLDIRLDSYDDLGVFVETTCGDPLTEVACVDDAWGGDPELLTVDVTAGVPVYIFVGGYSYADYGPYDLTVASSPHLCGDGIVSGTESCEDGNATGGDGCSSTCQVEVTETEPNDDRTTADANTTTPEVGIIDVPGDMDWWAVTVNVNPGETVEIVAELVDLQAVFGGDLSTGLCDDLTLDSEIEILDSTGTSLELNDDFGYYSYCSTAATSVSTSGTYYVRVASSQTWAPTDQFGYGLNITATAIVCGDGTQALSEECDDGNVADGDGCSATCVVEFCGDGFTNNTDEVCDDGNTTAGDGCRADCLGTETCGDGLIDAATGERCDDGNVVTGDGCDDQCLPEASESEPNNDYTSADTYIDPFIGRIDPIGDEDYVAIVLPNTSNSLTLETSDLGGLGSCSTQASYYGYTYTNPTIDTEMDLFDVDGTTVLASDNDSGPATCSRIEMTGLPAGTYYVRVAESTTFYYYTTPASNVFDYMLHAEVFPEECGDGIQAPLEQCDDGNIIAGDGCSDTCRLENVGFAGCASGTLTEFNATALAIPILDNARASSALPVTSGATVQDVKVRIDGIVHTYDNDLEIHLVSPTGTRVELSTNNGGGDDNYILTEIDDACDVVDGPIDAGAAPFTGCFSPEGNLSDFIGETATGDWTLEISDTANADTGTLNAWSLGLCL